MLKKVNVAKRLEKDMTLWRYMSLDKFIDLLSSKNLFLTPLAYYQSTDPFEGFAPQKLFEATMRIHLGEIEKRELKTKQIENMLLEYGDQPPKELIKSIETMNNMATDMRKLLIPIHNKISKSTCVHCWYHSESESEAMWKLYSDSGKGIAIKTTVSSLVDSLNSCEQEFPLSLGRVKYLDFLCDKLTTDECLSDGIASPLLKRKEYEHENEIRLYSVPQCNSFEEWEQYEAVPIRVPVDITTLIENVYISPYVAEPFNSSVWKVCELFDISKDKIINSQLLIDYENMLYDSVRV